MNIRISKSIVALMACIAILIPSLTSCLSDSEDKPLQYHTFTSEEKAKAISEMSGYYTGVVRYVKDAYKQDSLSASCIVRGDSTVEIQYPVALLATYVPTATLDAIEALKKAPAQTFKFKVSMPVYSLEDYWTNYWSKGYYETGFAPVQNTFHFEVENHNYELTFTTDNMVFGNSYMYSILTYYKSQVQANVLLKSFTYDGRLQSLDLPTVFYGRK